MTHSSSKSRSQFSLSGKRPSGKLDERKFFLIVTEGKTESRYFKHFRSTTGPRIESVDKQDSRIRLVEKAIELRGQYKKEKRYIKGDETWVVFDRDVDLGKPNDKETFNRALELACREDIQVAYSNDSFELWFLLHLQDVSASIHRSIIEKKLKSHLGCYTHGDDAFDRINSNYSMAVKRAEKILKEAIEDKKSPVDANPSTTVYLLTEKLRKSMKD
jgi:hypothetical protein